MKRYIFLTIAAGMIWAATPTFDVASIKPAPPVDPREMMHGNVRVGMTVDGARVDIANLTLMELIRIAYEVKPYQMAAPERVKGSERWDIQATLPEGAKPAQIPAMLQALLAERFKVAVHRETKEHPVYALVVGKSGPKMKEADPEVAGTEAPHGSHGRASGVPINAGAMSLFLTSEDLGPVRLLPTPGGGGMRFEAKKASMAGLADILSRMLDRPVVDMTGLKGKYEIGVDFAQENMRAMAAMAGFPMVGGGMGPENAAGNEPGTTLISERAGTRAQTGGA